MQYDDTAVVDLDVYSLGSHTQLATTAILKHIHEMFRRPPFSIQHGASARYSQIDRVMSATPKGVALPVEKTYIRQRCGCPVSQLFKLDQEPHTGDVTV